MKTIINQLVAAIVLGLSSLGASAQVSGTIGQVHVDASNGSLYVFLSSPTTMCSGGGLFVVVPSASTQFAGWIALSKSAGSSVTITSTNSGGNCWISYLVVAP